jgi:hypothetical protein
MKTNARVFNSAKDYIKYIESMQPKKIEKQITPQIYTILVAFFISFFLFFLVPIFFSAPTMQFHKYIMSTKEIGTDLQQMVNYGNSLLSGNSPYVGNNLYPPLATVVFLPFTQFNFHSVYIIISFITICCFVSITFFLPLRFGKVTPELVLVFITGLISYGFQFEIERGQFNVIAMTSCLWALYLINFTRYKKTAYALFILAVQLKVYPIFFIWMMSEGKIKNALHLGFVNFGFLFVLGWGCFVQFITEVLRQTQDINAWVGNHSLKSFLVQIYSQEWLIPMMLLTIAVWFYVNYKSRGFSPTLLLCCAITGMLLPAVSHDYKLSVLPAFMALFIQGKHSKSMIFIVAIIYSSMLFSYTGKFGYLLSNTPALIALLIIVLFSTRTRETHAKI